MSVYMKFFDVNCEIFHTILTPYTWVAFAWEELRDRYKRSIIGLLWIPIAFLLFVGVKVLVFSKLNSVGLEVFTIHVVVGYWIWQSINSTIIDSCNVFVRSGGFIKSSPLPYTVYILQGIFRNGVPFFYNFIIVFATIWLVTGRPNWSLFWVFPIFLIFFLNSIWLGMFLGVMAARFRDILHFTQTVMRLLFFLTPIIWMPEQLGRLGQTIAFYNPIAHFISIVRTPVSTGTIPLTSWIIVFSVTFVGWFIGLHTYAKTKRSIVHWI